MSHRRYSLSVKIFLAAFFNCILALQAQPPKIQPPPPGKLYHGFYWGGVGTDTHDPTEHDVTAADVVRYEEAVGAKTVWIYFSDNWFESRKFPAETCGWIRDAGKIPYIRLMLRSDVDQGHDDKKFSLEENHSRRLRCRSSGMGARRENFWIANFDRVGN